MRSISLNRDWYFEHGLVNIGSVLRGEFGQIGRAHV